MKFMLITILITLKKFEIFLKKCYFKLAFINFYPPIQTEFHYNVKIILLKRCLLYWIDYFVLKGYILSHLIELKNKTICDKKNYSFFQYKSIFVS